MTIDLNIDVSEVEGIIILHLDGRLDSQTSVKLEDRISKLLNDSRSILLLNFSKVSFLSSAGMRLLLAFNKKLQTISGKLIIYGLNDEVLEILKISGFEKFLNILDDEQCALQFALKKS